MMKKLLSLLYGDKIIWALAILLAMLSFLPVYSASTNLVYTIGTGKATTDYLFRHFVHLFIGICIMWYFHKRDYALFRKIAIIGMPIIALILLYTLLKGNTIGGANASRWLKIPLLGQFQPSSTAAIILLMYVAQYLTGIKDEVVTFKTSFWQLWVPVLVIIGLILPANFSTAALIFCMVCVLVFIGKYPFKYLMTIIGIGVCCMLVFVLVAKAFPGAFPHRVDTWISRIDRFAGPDDGTRDLYQVENAKMAIANGGLFGVGPGKSVLKNFLPQSSSDFIFAIIVEEWGLLGGFSILGIYLLLFYRFLIAVHKAPTLFGKLLVAGLGFYLIFQALINMGVAVSLLPTTGQALPLVSSGGTAIWMTCFAIAVILSVTKKEAEVQAEEQKRQEEEQMEQEMLHDLHLERLEKNSIEE